jgi:amino acid transporter
MRRRKNSAPRPHPTDRRKLGQWSATAICGNDILSTTLYVSGIAILFAGALAPLVLLGVGLLLLLYKLVYTEVVEALPLNGGAYNCLLNGTSKMVAAIAGVMTLLSYTATAVISSKVGIEYLSIPIRHFSGSFLHQEIYPPVILGTAGVLLVFAVLVITGMKDSARVALGIFVTHIATLVLFLLFGLWHSLTAHTFLLGNIARSASLLVEHGGLARTLFLAFAASLLGISGFESSANFVEEQKKGVFRKTLRNMLLGILIFGPLVALVVLTALPYEEIIRSRDFLLADAAFAIGGLPLQTLVAFDAFLVLSGATLTAYIGVSGLVHRMSADNCLPNFFTKQNRRGSFPNIVLGFFLLCISILLLTRGNLLSLAGLYSIAFLGVMGMFALGNLVLKQSRPELKRTFTAPRIAVFLAFVVTVLGIAGNVIIDPMSLAYFALYFVPAIAIVYLVIHQDAAIKSLIGVTGNLSLLHRFLRKEFADMTEGRFVVFIKGVTRLERIFRYIDRNEIGWDITLVHCGKHGQSAETDPNFRELKRTLPELQRAGFYPHFRLHLMYRAEPFGPRIVGRVTEELEIRKNRVFIGSIHHQEHPFDYDELGGVRIIF